MTSETREVVVVDTSCLIALSALDQLDLLRRFYGAPLVPPSVEREFGQRLPEWIRTREPGDPPLLVVLRATLGPGEAEAISARHRADGIPRDPRRPSSTPHRDEHGPEDHGHDRSAPAGSPRGTPSFDGARLGSHRWRRLPRDLGTPGRSAPARRGEDRVGRTASACVECPRGQPVFEVRKTEGAQRAGREAVADRGERDAARGRPPARSRARGARARARAAARPPRSASMRSRAQWRR